MNNLKYYLGFLWVLPVSIIAWLLIFFIWINRGVESIMWDHRLICVVDLNNENWFYRVFFKRRNWAGWSCGNVAFVTDACDNNSTLTYEQWNKVTVHEADGHCIQQYKWGVFWYPVYVIESIYLWFRYKKKHSYLDNHFEREARRVAGQMVDIPPEHWPDGPNDRWVFW